MGRTRKTDNASGEDRLEKRKAILAALARVTGEDPATAPGPDEDVQDSNGYYTLSPEEVAALLAGNIEKVETWVSNLDQRHATWLLRWLIKEGP